MKKKIGSGFRAKVALAALRGDKTLAELSSEYGIHANVIGQWKKLLLENSGELFEGKREKRKKNETHEKMVDELYQKIGKIEMENEWLKKKTRSLMKEEKIKMLEKKDSKYSIREQCQIL